MTSHAAAPFPPRLALGVAIAAVSTSAVFIRLADAPPLVVAFWRCALATALLALFMGRQCWREWRALTRRDLAVLAAAGLALAVHFAAWITSLSYTSVASSIVLVNTTPLWVALAAPLVTTDRVQRMTWVAIGVAVVGCTIIGAGDFELSGDALLGDGLALLGAILCATFMLVGRRLRQTLSLGPYVVGLYGVAALFLLVFALVSGTSLTGYSTSTFGWIVCLALIPQVLGHSSYNYALRYVSAALTSIATLGESVGATLLAWWILGDEPSAQTLVGGALVLVGMAIAVRAERT